MISQSRVNAGWSQNSRRTSRKNHCLNSVNINSHCLKDKIQIALASDSVRNSVYISLTRFVSKLHSKVRLGTEKTISRSVWNFKNNS